MPGGGHKTGDFDTSSFLVGARVGKLLTIDTFRITPTVGL
jgi:hypothetical protein